MWKVSLIEHYEGTDNKIFVRFACRKSLAILTRVCVGREIRFLHGVILDWIQCFETFANSKQWRTQPWKSRLFGFQVNPRNHE